MCVSSCANPVRERGLLRVIHQQRPYPNAYFDVGILDSAVVMCGRHDVDTFLVMVASYRCTSNTKYNNHVADLFTDSHSGLEREKALDVDGLTDIYDVQGDRSSVLHQQAHTKMKRTWYANALYCLPGGCGVQTCGDRAIRCTKLPCTVLYILRIVLEYKSQETEMKVGECGTWWCDACP